MYDAGKFRRVVEPLDRAGRVDQPIAANVVEQALGATGHLLFEILVAHGIVRSAAVAFIGPNGQFFAGPGLEFDARADGVRALCFDFGVEDR